MDDLKREFRGVWIAAEIWLDKRLNMLEKGVLAEIDSLDNETTGCTAGNEYLADFCGCSERKVSEAIGKLISLNYIYVESFNGRTRVLRSRIAESARESSRICEAAPQNLQHINKDINKDIINEGIKRFTPPTLEEVQAYCQERKNKVDPQRFIDFYTSKGWFVGKNKMKDWRAAVRTWEKKDNAKHDGRQYTDEELKAHIISFGNLNIDDL